MNLDEIIWLVCELILLKMRSQNIKNALSSTSFIAFSSHYFMLLSIYSVDVTSKYWNDLFHARW